MWLPVVFVDDGHIDVYGEPWVPRIAGTQKEHSAKYLGSEVAIRRFGRTGNLDGYTDFHGEPWATQHLGTRLQLAVGYLRLVISTLAMADGNISCRWRLHPDHVPGLALFQKPSKPQEIP